MLQKIFYILVGTLLLTPLVQAAAPVFTTYPTHTSDRSKWINRDVNPGENYQENLTVENLSDQPIKLNIKIVESTGSKDHIKLLEDVPYQNIGNWINPEFTEIKLKAKEKKSIKLNIQVPADTELGQYQSVALVSDLQSSDQQLQINTRIGSRIYLNVTNNSILQSNTFSPDIPILQLSLVILSLGGIIYGLLPSRKLVNQKT